MRDLGQDALELVELGWQVFPLHTWNVDRCDCGRACTSPAKHPRTMHGLKDASSEIPQVVEWWGQWPAANIGVRTGAESGIVVVDIDPRHGGAASWTALVEAQGFEHDGPACITGSGGMHLYFAHPGEMVKNSTSEIAEGVDVRGDGGYVVAPPSIHMAGTSYYWVEGYAPWERDSKPIPVWLLEAIKKPVSDGFGAAPVADKIPTGKRRSAMLSLGGSMRRRNMGETSIFNALMAENLEKCSPPLDARDIAMLAADIVQRYQPGEATILPSSKPNKDRARERYVPEPKTFASLKGKKMPAIRWAVAGVLPQGLGMLAGAPKLGKSYFALGLCFDVAQGDDALGYFPTGASDTLYLALEDGEARLQKRSEELLSDADWPERAHYETQWPRVGEGGAEAMEAWLGQHPEARLVIIDTFALFKPENVGGRKGDVYAEDYAAVRAVKEIADRFSVCILVVTHVNKAAHTDWVNTMTGSTGLSGAADTLLNMARPEGERGRSARDEAVLRLTGRDVEENAWFLRRRKGWWRAEGDEEELRETREQDETIHFMQMLYEDGFTEVTPAMLAKLTNRRSGTCQQMLGRAYHADKIIRVRQGVYALPESYRLYNNAEKPTKPTEKPTGKVRQVSAGMASRNRQNRQTDSAAQSGLNLEGVEK